ncbi:hypothetical protein ACQEVZ_58790 [Dactylosporangium sp. CA-152071]|uniref:hypothetical protein n=1 Tax=Dactylosporangium sp. CA-152071 TaxID=3239933 RepID=UPI003D938C42
MTDDPHADRPGLRTDGGVGCRRARWGAGHVGSWHVDDDSLDVVRAAGLDHCRDLCPLGVVGVGDERYGRQILEVADLRVVVSVVFGGEPGPAEYFRFGRDDGLVDGGGDGERRPGRVRLVGPDRVQRGLRNDDSGVVIAAQRCRDQLLSDLLSAVVRAGGRQTVGSRRGRRLNGYGRGRGGRGLTNAGRGRRLRQPGLRRTDTDRAWARAAPAADSSAAASNTASQGSTSARRWLDALSADGCGAGVAGAGAVDVATVGVAVGGAAVAAGGVPPEVVGCCTMVGGCTVVAGGAGTADGIFSLQPG